MAAQPKANYIGVESIMNAFDSFYTSGYPFSLWCQGLQLHRFNGDDSARDIAALEQALTAMANAENNDVLQIRIYNPKHIKGGIIKGDTVPDSTIVCRVTSVGAGRVIGGVPVTDNGNIPYPLYDTLQKAGAVGARLDDQDRKINQLLEAVQLLATNGIPVIGDVPVGDDEIEEDTEEPELDMLDKISGFIEKPIVQQFLQHEGIKTAIANLISGVVPMFSQVKNMVPPAQVAGVKQDTMIEETQKTETVERKPISELTEQEYTERLNEVLNRLNPHTDLLADLERLADVAEQKPDMFKMLLQSLRSL